MEAIAANTLAKMRGWVGVNRMIPQISFLHIVYFEELFVYCSVVVVVAKTFTFLVSLFNCIKQQHIVLFFAIVDKCGAIIWRLLLKFLTHLNCHLK